MINSLRTTLHADRSQAIERRRKTSHPPLPTLLPLLLLIFPAQIRAERAPSMPMEELQQHSVNVIQHLHHDAAHPAPDEVHNPSSDSEAVQKNMDHSKQKTDVHHPL